MTIAATETFHDVQGLIYWTVSKFKEQYGGDFDDLVSEANLIFTELYSGEGRAFVQQGNRSFSSALHWLISHQLLDQLRYRAFRNNRCRVSCREILPEKTQNNHGSWLVDLMDELSDDARTIVEIVLETPDSILRLEMDDFKDGHPKTCIKKYMQTLGWNMSRIKRTFQEISEALS